MRPELALPVYAPCVAIQRIVIEPALWSKATSVRQREWNVLIGDALSGAPLFPGHERATSIELGLVDGRRIDGRRIDGSRIDGRSVDLRGGAGVSASPTIAIALLADEERLVELAIPRNRIDDELTEYLAVIDRLEDENLTLARAEALDMAKRVVHDAAAKKLGELVPDLGPGLEEKRRFFSLAVSLFVDTTGKKAAHRHF